jgi:hypothetical protein
MREESLGYDQKASRDELSRGHSPEHEETSYFRGERNGGVHILAKD